MKIDKEKLIGLLIEKTGMEKVEVEEQLQQLIKRIVDAAERGKALEIKEFGMFYFDEGGELRFDAAKELSTEVNFKYAGMEPVELKPARESANKQEDEEEDTEAASAKKEETAADEEKAKDQGDDDADDVFGIGAGGTQKKSDKDDEEKKATDRPELADDEYDFEYEEGEPKEREEDPFAGLLGDASSKMQKGEPSGFEMSLLSEEAKRKLAEEEESKEEEEAVEPEEEFVEADPVATSSDDKDEIDEDIFAGLDDLDDLDDDEPVELPEESAEKKTPEPEPVAASARRPAPKPKKKERDPIMMVLGVILALVLIGSAFVIIPSLMDGPDPDQNQVPATAPQQPAVDEDIADAQDVLVPLEPEADAEVTEEMADEIEAAEDSDQPIYGLTGEIVDQANDGFSIVLFSLRQEERARDQAANLSEDGYRVIVNSRTVDGETVWRVSVGQFESIADAQTGATDLPSPYNTNNFIQRIQTN
ncbi:MAG: SPOR domain-containing protein [Balneolaceae bacterium]|nr:SPOR domain-containing protein [Balneolaceae bacterium]